MNYLNQIIRKIKKQKISKFKLVKIIFPLIKNNLKIIITKIIYLIIY